MAADRGQSTQGAEGYGFASCTKPTQIVRAETDGFGGSKLFDGYARNYLNNSPEC